VEPLADLTLRAPAPTDGVSLFAILLLTAGLAVRHNRDLHPRIMGTAFLVDVGLVLYLELTRGAIERASRLASQLLSLHVACAVATLVLNVFLLVSGWRILNRGGDRRVHFRGAVLFMVLRVVTFLTAFLIPARG
jgi:uncharacterized membrane protein YozB (DUF420 family)